MVIASGGSERFPGSKDGFPMKDPGGSKVPIKPTKIQSSKFSMRISLDIPLVFACEDCIGVVVEHGLIFLNS